MIGMGFEITVKNRLSLHLVTRRRTGTQKIGKKGRNLGGFHLSILYDLPPESNPFSCNLILSRA